MKKILLLFILILNLTIAFSQVQFSLATDASVLYNFSNQQRFLVFGQTVQANFHFTKKQSAYAWVSYYSPGHFKNTFIASAKSPLTNPSSINYTVEGRWRYRQISLGWKHYFKGSYDEENKWNLFGLAGFGLLFSNAENTLQNPVDTSKYIMQSMPAIGSYQFKRLTLDLGIGIEYPIGSTIYLYGDIRTWVPASSYPSEAFHNKRNVPLPLMANGGLRVLFD